MAGNDEETLHNFETIFMILFALGLWTTTQYVVIMYAGIPGVVIMAVAVILLLLVKFARHERNRKEAEVKR